MFSKTLTKMTSWLAPEDMIWRICYNSKAVNFDVELFLKSHSFDNIMRDSIVFITTWAPLLTEINSYQGMNEYTNPVFMWNVITHPCPNLKSSSTKTIIEFRAWMNSYIPLLGIDLIIYSCTEVSLIITASHKHQYFIAKILKLTQNLNPCGQKQYLPYTTYHII